MLRKANILVTGLTPIANGLFAHPRNSEDTDKLLGTKMINKLDAIKLKTVVPHKIMAQRTLYVKQVDDSVGQHTEAEVLNEKLATIQT